MHFANCFHLGTQIVFFLFSAQNAFFQSTSEYSPMQEQGGQNQEFQEGGDRGGALIPPVTVGSPAASSEEAS